MKNLITTLLFMMLSMVSVSAQNLNEFTLELEGKEVAVTQDIDAKFTGYYLKGEGNQKWQYGLFQNGSSFYFEQTLSDPFNQEYDWDASKKENIKWGVLVENGEIATTEVNEFENGQMVSYQAMILVYQTEDSSEVRDVLLYEKNGQFHLESAVKTSAIASVD